MSLITILNIEVKTLINYVGTNVLMPLKRSGFPINLTLLLNPLAVLNKINHLIQTNSATNFFTTIVCPTTQSHIQDQLPFSILVTEEPDILNYRKHMPSFLIECFFAPSNDAQRYEQLNRQVLAHSCLPMLYNTETYNTINYHNYLESSQNIEFENV